MKSVIRLIELNGGLTGLGDRPIRVDTTPGLILASVAHYFEQNGDLMADPEMTFEVDPTMWPKGYWRPASITQAAVGIYREAVFRNADGVVIVRAGLIRELTAFARMWDRNIRSRGYVDAFRSRLPGA